MRRLVGRIAGVYYVPHGNIWCQYLHRGSRRGTLHGGGRPSPGGARGRYTRNCRNASFIKKISYVTDLLIVFVPTPHLLLCSCCAVELQTHPSAATTQKLLNSAHYRKELNAVLYLANEQVASIVDQLKALARTGHVRTCTIPAVAGNSKKVPPFLRRAQPGCVTPKGN